MKISRTRKRIFHAGFLLCAVLLSGCSRQAEQEKIQITLMHGWGGTLETHKLMQSIYADFAEQNPDIELNCIPYSDSSIAVGIANDMLAVSKMPDIISTNGLSYYVANAVKQGMALDLMPYIEKDPDLKSRIHPSILATWTTDSGRLYTVPDALEVAGYWYNEEYFRQAGTVDENGSVLIPRTWKEFLETVKKLDAWASKNRPDLCVFALDDVQITDSVMLARIAGEGTNGLSLAQHAPLSMDQDAIQKAVLDIRTLYEYSNNVNSIENARQSFYDGRSMIYFNGVWESDLLSDSPQCSRFRYAAYPTSSGKSLSYVSPSSGYVISNHTDQAKNEACIRFLRYILSDEVQVKIALETGQAPSNPNIDRQKLILEFPLLGNALDISCHADIQIKTITSVWRKEQVTSLFKTIQSGLEKADADE